MIVGLVAGVAPFFKEQLPWWVSLIGVAFLLLGVFMLKSASSSLIVLRRAGNSEITTKKLIGGALTNNTFNSGLATSVRLETHTDYSKSSSSTERDTPQRERVSRLFLAMQDGSEVELGSKRVTGSSGLSLSGFSAGSIVAAPLNKEATQVAEFLGVPLDASQRGEMGVIEVAQAAQALFTTGTQATPPTSPVAQTPVEPTPVPTAVEVVAPVAVASPAAPAALLVPPVSGEKPFQQ